MAELLEIREYLRGIYSRFDLYIEPVLKFILSVVALMLIDMNIGYMDRLQNPAIVLIAALVCSFMPVNVLLVIAAAFCVLHAYALSIECAVLVAAVFVLMLLVYFRFVPSDALVVILTPVCFAAKIPYVIPLVCGLAGTPLSAISACFGVVVYYLLDFIKVNEAVIGSMEEESTVVKFRYIVDTLLGTRAMLVMIAAFAVTIVLVYIIRRLSVNHSWTIALMTGFFVNVILVLVGDMTAGVEVSLVAVILGALVSLALAIVIKFFIFAVDYTRTEMLQFEDDEYYYYVKAVPKMTVAVPEKKVKHINQKKTAQDYPVFTSARVDEQGEEPGKAVPARGYSSGRAGYGDGAPNARRTPRPESGAKRSATAGSGLVAEPIEDDVKIRRPSEGSARRSRSANPERGQGYRRPVRPQGGASPQGSDSRSTSEMNTIRRSQPQSGPGRTPVRGSSDRVIRRRPPSGRPEE